MIKNSFDIVGNFVTDLFKDCIRQCYVPEKWKTSKVVFIPKVGKTDYSNAKNFRPISLMSFLLKGLERMLLWFLEEKNSKFGFVTQESICLQSGPQHGNGTALHYSKN